MFRRSLRTCQRISPLFSSPSRQFLIRSERVCTANEGFGKNSQSISEETQYKRLLHRSVRSNNLQDAEQLINIMKQKDIKPSQSNIETMIEAFAQQFNQEKVSQYIHILLNTGYPLQIDLINNIIKSYISMNAIQQAAMTFHQALKLKLRPNLETFKLLFAAFFSNHQHEAILSLQNIMHEYEVKMDQEISNTILASLMCTQKPREILQHFHEAHSSRVFPTPEMRLNVLKFLVQRNLLKEAEKLHNGFLESSGISHMVLIRGYLNSNCSKKAQKLLEDMQKKKLLMSSEMCADFLRYYIQQQKTKTAFYYFNDVPKNFKNSPVLFLVIMEALQANGFHSMVPDMFKRFVKQFDMLETVKFYNIRITMELNAFHEDGARDLFAEMRKKDITPTITTYNQFFNWWTNSEAPDNYGSRIEELWDEMLENRIQPNADTFLYLIRYALMYDNVETANEWFMKLVNEYSDIVPYAAYDLMIKYYSTANTGFAKLLLERLISFAEKDRSRELYNSIIAGFIAFKDTMNAFKYFDIMDSCRIYPNQKSFNLLIQGYCYYSFITEAAKQMGEMKERGIDPNVDTFNSLIFGCAKVGDMINARKYFLKMDKLDIPFTRDTYLHIIAGYYRAGDPETAEAFAGQIDCQYNVEKLQSRSYFV